MLDEYKHYSNTMKIISDVFEQRLVHKKLMTQYIKIQNMYFQQNKGLQDFLQSKEVMIFRELIT